MSCISPLLVHRNSVTLEISILDRSLMTIYEAEKKYGKDNIFFIPCGKCSACRLAKRREWAVRCAMEAKDYGDDISFVTLTYDDEHYKGSSSLGLKTRKDYVNDYQKFLKRVRNLGYKIRYFGCLEPGSNTGRYHFHIILFGFNPDDKKFYSKSKSDSPVFVSEKVSNCWDHKGFVTVQNFDPAEASYVAGYVSKKLVPGAESMIFMSKKPGLGYAYLERYADKLSDNDLIVDDFGKIKKAYTPRYFSKMAERLGIDLTMTKQKRLEAMELAQAGEMLQYGLEREDILEMKADEYERKERRLKRGL